MYTYKIRSIMQYTSVYSIRQTRSERKVATSLTRYILKRAGKDFGKSTLNVVILTCYNINIKC